ncbi:MAG: efflux transporter outer membrane subunit [Nitrospiraceae bacterium]
MRMPVVIGLSCLLISCTMGPDYERPKMEGAEAFRMGEPHADASSIANLAWWEILQDEPLQQLVRIALEENKDLQRAVAVVDEFQARAGLARSDFLPGVSASGSAPALGRKTSFLVPGFVNPFNYYLQGNLAWELDLWGRVRRANEAARAELLSKEENRRAVVLQLVSGVAESYFNLLQFDAQLDIARGTLQSWEESVRIARARLKQGVTSRLDLDQFVAARANAVVRTAELERQMVQAENQLSVLLGRKPFTIPRGRSLTDQVMPPSVPAGLPSDLLQRRPDLLQAEQELAAATAHVGVAKADRFPRISLTGLLGVSSPKLSRLFTDPASFGVAGVGVTAPLLNGPALGFQQEAAEAQARQAVAQYQERVLTAFREVEDSLVAVRTLLVQHDAQRQQVTALQSALRLAELRYKGGLASYLDVLVARRNLFEAELSLTGTRRLHLVSVVQLYKALGGGWSPDMERPTDRRIGS